MMAIKPVCLSCKRELEEPGAILLSPPDSKGMIEKLHICVDCYRKLQIYWRNKEGE